MATLVRSPHRGEDLEIFWAGMDWSCRFCDVYIYQNDVANKGKLIAEQMGYEIVTLVLVGGSLL